MSTNCNLQSIIPLLGNRVGNNISQNIVDEYN